MSHTNTNDNKALDKLKELKQQKYYLWLDRNKVSLYHLPSQKIYSLEKIDKDIQEYIKRSLPWITEKVFQPNKPELIEFWDSYHHNTYKEYKPKKSTPSDISLFLEFLERLFPVKEERNHIIQYFAHMLQKPEERPPYALLLTSESRTGKGFLYHKILTHLVCHQCQQNDNYNAFHGKHSNSLVNTMLVMLDDPKSDHPSTMTKLKSRISEPRITYEAKGEEAKTVEAFARIILASNERRPLDLDESDINRWFAPQFIKHKESPEETAKFIKQLEQSLCLDSIYNYFMSVSIDDFDCRLPPETETRNEMLIGSKDASGRSDIEDYINENKVFHWDDLKKHLELNISDKAIKDILLDLEFHSRKISVKPSRKVLWFHKSWSNPDAVKYWSEQAFLQ